MLVPVRQTERVSTAGGGWRVPPKQRRGRPPPSLTPWEQRRQKEVLHSSHPPVSTWGARQGGRGDRAEGLLPPCIRLALQGQRPSASLSPWVLELWPEPAWWGWREPLRDGGPDGEGGAALRECRPLVAALAVSSPPERVVLREMNSA